MRAGQRGGFDASRPRDDRRARLHARRASSRPSRRADGADRVATGSSVRGARPRRAGRRRAVVRRRGSRRDRFPATAMWATSSATTCCRRRSARCARRHSCRRRWLPETAASLERVCVVGTRGLRDFHAGLCAANLLKARDRGACGRGRRRSRPRRSERARAGAEIRRSGMARRRSRPGWRCSSGRGAASAYPLCSAFATRTAPGQTWSIASAGGVRDPDIATVGSGDAAVRILRGVAAGRRRPPGAGAEVVGAERDGTRVSRWRRARTGRRDALRGGLVRARQLAGSPRARSSSIRDGQPHERVLGLPLRGLPSSGEPRFVRRLHARSSRWRASASPSTLELRAEGCENVLVAGAALPGAAPWREGSGEGIALASGSHAAQVVLARLGSLGEGGGTP